MRRTSNYLLHSTDPELLHRRDMTLYFSTRSTAGYATGNSKVVANPPWNGDVCGAEKWITEVVGYESASPHPPLDRPAPFLGTHGSATLRFISQRLFNHVKSLWPHMYWLLDERAGDHGNRRGCALPQHRYFDDQAPYSYHDASMVMALHKGKAWLRLRLFLAPRLIAWI
jgi:hypothetical protein